MGVKDFFVKKMLERQVKNLPKDQQDLIMTMFEKKPELFEKIAIEVREKKKNGQEEMLATMSVMKKYQSEMQKLAKEIQKGK